MARNPPSVSVYGILTNGYEKYPLILKYQSISDTPITRTDLSALTEPTKNTYYQHTGTTTDAYTNGIIYFYDGSEYRALDGKKSSGTNADIIVAEDGDITQLFD